MKSDVRPLGGRAKTFVVHFLLVAAVWVVFGQTARHQFVDYDDPQYVCRNQRVLDGLSAQGVIWALTTRHAGNWHPLTWLSHMLDSQLFGEWPGGHHLTSVALHAASALLLFGFLRRMTGSIWPSAFAAALFAVHPLRAESVAWVAERKDVLSGFFFMLTLWAYVGYVRRTFSWARYLSVAAAFAIGLMAKPMLVTVPFVLLLLDYWPLKRAGAIWSREGQGGIAFGRLMLEKVPLFVLAAVSCVLTVWAQSSAVRSLEELPVAARVANAVAAYVGYLRQMIWPAGLAVFYPHPGNSLPGWRTLLDLLLLAAISAGALACARKRPYVLVGWLWYLGMLVPVIGLLQVGEQAMADRYTYLPQIGLYLALAWWWADVAGAHLSRRWASTVPLVLLAALLVCARRQVSYWRDSEKLWSHALECTPDNYTAYCSLGTEMLNRGLATEAVDQYRRALKVRSDYPIAHNNLGLALAACGKHGEAIAQYQVALEIAPRYADALCNLGFELERRGLTNQAAIYYAEALGAEPDHAEAHVNLGNLLRGSGQIGKAIHHYREALRSKPAFALAHNGLGAALFQNGQTEEGIAHLQKAVELSPGCADARGNLSIAHNALGLALAHRGQFDEAIAHFQRALDIKPENADARRNLAAARRSKP